MEDEEDLMERGGSAAAGCDGGGQGRGWVQMRPRIWKNLDELYAGICDGMTYEEIAETYPEEFACRKKDKLKYRYPRGESYLDVIHRLDPIVHEMESYQHPLLIIGHQGILRVLYAYFMGLDRSEAPKQSIPLNTVLKLTPKTYGCDEERFRLIDGVQPSQGHFESIGASGGTDTKAAEGSATSVVDPPSC